MLLNVATVALVAFAPLHARIGVPHLSASASIPAGCIPLAGALKSHGTRPRSALNTPKLCTAGDAAVLDREPEAIMDAIPSDSPPPLKLADVQPPPPTEQKPDLFIPILVGVSFGGYGLIILYDVFFGNGLCGLTVDCANTPFSW